MGNIGSGAGSGYPASLDTQTSVEVNSPDAGKTLARAEVPNDLASCILAIEQTLGTNPQGTVADVKTLLQVEHNTNGTHSTITNSTLTTPVIASFYQDAGKTKLMTTPDTASDTICAIAATQTLSNKTVASPTITGTIGGTAALGDGMTATTQAASDNSTKVATTAYVDTAVGNLVGYDSASKSSGTQAIAAAGLSAFKITNTGSGTTITVTISGGTAGQHLVVMCHHDGGVATTNQFSFSTGFKDDGNVSISTKGDALAVLFFYDGSLWNEVSRTASSYPI